MTQSAPPANVSQTTTSARVIGVVDDEESVREGTRRLLRSAGYQVRTFACAEDLLGSGALDETACLILDVRMPGIDGLELQERLKLEGRSIPIIFITAHADARMERRARSAGAVDMLRKPFAANDLLDAVKTALGRTLE